MGASQTCANLIGVYSDGSRSVQLPSYPILRSAGSLESLMGSLWKPVKFIMKEGGRGGARGRGSAVLTFSCQGLRRGNTASYFHHI